MEAGVWSEGILPLLTILLGAPMGSFACLLADRLPRREPVVLSRSLCRSCGQVLRWWEIIPILSYVGLRGRCAHCGDAIPSRLVQAEIAGLGLALIAVWAGLGVIGALVLWCLLALILSDLAHYRLPNVFTFALLFLALAFAVFSTDTARPDLILLWRAILGAAIGAGIFYAISFTYRLLRGRSGMGAGDIRLMGGIGALVVPASGWVDLALVTLIAGLAGLALGVLRAVQKGRTLSATTPIPFGACLAMAAAVVWVAAIVRPDLFAVR